MGDWLTIQIWRKIKKPSVEEISASSIGQIIPNDKHVSNDDIVEEQGICSAGRGVQDQKKSVGSAKTGLIGHETSPTSPFENFWEQPQNYDG